MSNNEYVRLSLELHLFFDRIMKEHSFFLRTAFLDKNNNLKQIAKDFQKSFADILKKVSYLADGLVSNGFLSANEMVTKNTYDAEKKTSELSGVYIDSDITMQELALRIGIQNVSSRILNNISNINKQTLALVKKLIKFKNEILNNVLLCKIYTTNYPLLITHIMNEAKMYYMLLNKLENRSLLTKNELYEQEVF